MERRVIDVDCENIGEFIRFSKIFPVDTEECQIIPSLYKTSIERKLVNPEDRIVLKKTSSNSFLLTKKCRKSENIILFSESIPEKKEMLKRDTDYQLLDVYSLSQEELAYNREKLNQRVRFENLFLNKFETGCHCTDETFVSVGVSHSIGGSIAEIYSIGAMSALIDAGLHKVCTYEIGVSGGSWATILLNQCHFNTEEIRNRIREWLSPEKKEGILDMVFETFSNIFNNKNVYDVYKSYLEEQLPNGDATVKDWTVTEGPIPLVVAARFHQKPTQEMHNFRFEQTEFTPFWTYFEKLKLRVATRKLTKIESALKISELLVAAGDVFSVPLHSAECARLGTTYLPNLSLVPPFCIDNVLKRVAENERGFYATVKDDELAMSEKLQLTDGGVIGNFAILPLLRRNCQIILITNVSREIQGLRYSLQMLSQRMDEFRTEFKSRLPQSFLTEKKLQQEGVQVFPAESPDQVSIVYLHLLLDKIGLEYVSTYDVRMNQAVVDQIFNQGKTDGAKGCKYIADLMKRLLNSE